MSQIHRQDGKEIAVHDGNAHGYVRSTADRIGMRRAISEIGDQRRSLRTVIWGSQGGQEHEVDAEER
jgi:hypothetical protein